MNKKDEQINHAGNKANDLNSESLPGYPIYPQNEDIYSKFKEEKDIDPEDISKKKEFIDIHSLKVLNEKDFNDDLTGSDLDIPGTELDEDQEAIGSEDEENHLYSLGGDDHNDLEEDKGI